MFAFFKKAVKAVVATSLYVIAGFLLPHVLEFINVTLEKVYEAQLERIVIV